MKVRQQCINNLKLRRRKKEYVSFSLINIEKSSIQARHGFQAACGCGTDGDNAVPGFFGGVYGGNRFRANLKILRVHLVLGDIFNLHRQKSSRADVQGDKANLHVARPDFFQNFRREM